MSKETKEIVGVPVVNQEELKNLPDANAKGEIKADLLEFTNVNFDKPLSTIERYVVEMKVRGYSNKRIAKELGLPYQYISRTLSKPYVKEFYNAIMKEIKENAKNVVVSVIMRTLEDKIEQIEKHGGNFANATDKDILDIAKMLDDVMKEEERKKLGTTGNVFVNILQQVIKD